MLKRIILTLIITYFYCCLWIWLEKAIEGTSTNRTVDNIIMLLFIPIIYIATGTIIKWLNKLSKGDHF